MKNQDCDGSSLSANDIVGRGRGRGESLTPESSKGTVERPVEDSTVEKWRDGRENQSIYSTRPEHIVTKSVESNGVQLYANYFKLIVPTTFKFVQYRVDFTPEVELLKLRRLLVAQCRPIIEGYVYDGRNLLYLTHYLEDDPAIIPVVFQSIQYIVTLRFTTDDIKATDSMAMMTLNSILRNAMRGLNLKLIQRNLYDPLTSIDIPECHLELWPGYITSIRKHEQDILVCCEISHKVLRKDTVHDIMRRLMQDLGDVPKRKTAISKEIVGTVVLTKYNNRTYRVDDVDWAANPMSRFQAGDKQMTLVEYYQTRYNIEIRDRRQPLLVSNPKARDVRGGRNEPVLLVPELCFPTGLTEKMKNNYDIMGRLSQYTRMDPKTRVQRLLDFSLRINQTRECVESMEAFGVGLDRNLLQVSGRILKQETILFGNGRTVQNDKRADWTQAIQKPMYQSIVIERWGVIYPNRFAHEFQDFWEILKNVAEGSDIEINTPKFIALSNDKLNTYVENLESFCAKDPKFVMVILPDNRADRYIAVKNITCVNRAIPSQVVLLKTLKSKNIKSIATKILVQINAKLGGTPWMINIPLSGLMTIGFDVTHDARDKSKSFGAFVASMDLKKKVAFYSTVSPHRSGEECSSNIGVHMQKALMAYREEHGSFPERILFYRDGVGDGQIRYVREIEVEKIKNVIRGCYGDQKPKFAFIIVSKRINSRIFTKSNGNNFGNPVCGTVVDNNITLPERYDFFLISQSVRQGTVSPTNYNIIEDNFGLSTEKMQMLTYKMCHLYYNWSGTTKVPAVVQYAHKLSILVGQFLHYTPNMGLDKSLYYL